MTGLMFFFLTGGCTVNQAREVQIYRDVLDGGKSGGDVAFHPDDPLTLERAMKLANAHNEGLAVAGEDYLQALIAKDRAFAAFLPKISLAPEFMHQAKTTLGADNPLIAEFVPEKATDVPVEGDMDWHLFRDIPAFRAAGSSVRMQKAMLLDRQAILLLDVAETYFQVMHSEEQVKVLQHAINVNEQRLSDVRVKEKVGVARPMDVSLAGAQLAATRNRMIQAQDDVKNGRAMLAFLIGAPAVNGPLLNGLEVPDAAWNMASLRERADSHRQDLIAAHERVHVAAVALEAAWGEYFPSVSLNLTSYLSRESFPSDVDWTSMIKVNIPIFSAGLIHADVRTAYSRLRQARLAEMYIERQVSKDLQVALENLQGDEQQIDQLGIQVQAAQDGLKQADAAFNTGLGTNLERLMAQDGLLSAELALSTATYNRSVDYLRLLRVTGALNPDLSPPETNNIQPMKDE